MKEIIYNYDNITEDEIDRKVKRTKIILENNEGNILIVKEFDAYQLPGGHLEPGEDYNTALVREIKEEAGIDIEYKERTPILKIRYLKKNFPIKNENTEFIGYYYADKLEQQPDLNKLNLTFMEQNSNFELGYIHKDFIIKELENNLAITEYKNTVSDTLEAIREYLK